MNKSVHIIQAPPVWLKVPPLSLAFLKTYLESKKINAKVINLNQNVFTALGLPAKKWLTLNQSWEENLFTIVKKHSPLLLKKTYQEIKKSHFIGFTLFKRNLNFSLSLAEEIKKIYPEKQIIFGGPETLFLDRKNRLSPSCYWVIGEGEIPLEKIINGNRKKIYRFCQVKKLDTLPFLNFDFCKIRFPGQALPIFSSRGCKFRCCFCTESRLYSNFRNHSPQYIADQIFHLRNKYKITNFIFSDSFLNYSQTWLEEFCNLAIQNKLNIKWEAQFRVNKLPLGLARLIKKSGCYNLFIGLESGSDKVLEAMQKKFTTSQAFAFFKTLNQANIHFEVSLILGYPGETEKDFQKTINFILKNKRIIPKLAQVNPFIDYFGNFKKKGLADRQKKERVEKFLKIIKNERIPYTKSFVNNLIHQ